jgi:ribosomal protein L22
MTEKTKKIDEKEMKTIPVDSSKNEIIEEKKSESSKLKSVHKEKKFEAIAKTIGAHISMKNSNYIGQFIKNKSIDQAILDLEQVLKFKRAVPFKGEIPHRKGKIMSGRYPIKASKAFILALKSLKGNAIINGLDLEKTRITIASASWGVRPMRKGGMKGKRTNLTLIAKELGVNKK